MIHKNENYREKAGLDVFVNVGRDTKCVDLFQNFEEEGHPPDLITIPDMEDLRHLIIVLQEAWEELTDE